MACGCAPSPLEKPLRPARSRYLLTRAFSAKTRTNYHTAINRTATAIVIATIATIATVVYIAIQPDPPPPAPPPVPATTTTTISECETRWSWLTEDRVRYIQTKQTMLLSADAIGTGSDADFWATLVRYVRDYEPALHLWLRYETDARAVLRDCWDTLTPGQIDALRYELAADDEQWLTRRAFCRGISARARNNPYLWGALGVSC